MAVRGGLGLSWCKGAQQPAGWGRHGEGASNWAGDRDDGEVLSCEGCPCKEGNVTATDQRVRLSGDSAWAP